MGGRLLAQRLRRIADAPVFGHFVTVAILVAGVLVGIETYPEFAERHSRTLYVLDKIILGIFILEIAIKLGAEGRHPLRYFRDPWNVFDFTIVAACLLPFGSSSVTVLRLLRLLRVLRLVRALPKLQLLVNALLKSIPSMAYVTVLLFLLFYIYGVAAVFLFGPNDPIHFRSLEIALLSLFRVVTLEDWTDIMYTQMFGCEGYGYSDFPELCTASAAQPVLAAIFFVSFVLLGTMIMLNLFIGVIMNGMDEAYRDTKDTATEPEARKGAAALEEQLVELRANVERLEAALVATFESEDQGGEPTPARDSAP